MRITADRALDWGLYLLKFIGVGWVYVLSDLKLKARPVCKVGFKTDTLGERVGDIVASIDRAVGYASGVGLVWAMPSLAPREVERIVHWIFRLLKTEVYPGSSGWTEWYKGYNFITALSITAIGYLMGADWYMILATAGVAFIFPHPMDLSLAVTLCSAIQVAIAYLFVCLLKYAAGIIALFIF